MCDMRRLGSINRKIQNKHGECASQSGWYIHHRLYIVPDVSRREISVTNFWYAYASSRDLTRVSAMFLVSATRVIWRKRCMCKTILYTFINEFHNKQFISATNKIFNIQDCCNFVNYITFWHFPYERELTWASAMFLVSATRVMNSRHLTREIRDHRRKSRTQIYLAKAWSETSGWIYNLWPYAYACWCQFKPSWLVQLALCTYFNFLLC